MAISDIRDEIDDEVSTILASDFIVNVSKTSTVPHSGDGGITYPNLDSKQQSCKLVETCVLYVDIRRSTELNLSHKPITVAKLYSAFVRAMTRCARHFNGHVRGIIGDRLMVIFDAENCFYESVECAILMNSTAKYIINKHFKANEFACGIGIDYGKMLATKTGVRRRGQELANYRNLVWLGRPANVASKLTDLASKDGEYVHEPAARLAYGPDAANWTWIERPPSEVLESLDVEYGTRDFKQTKSPRIEAFFMTRNMVTVRPRTPAILMTDSVWEGFKLARPYDQCVANGWIYPVDIKVPGFTGQVMGCGAEFIAFRP